MNKKDLACFLLLGGFCLFLFKDILIGGHLLYGSDFVVFYLGMKQFFLNQLQAHGSIPFWNPYIFSGMPFWAHFESCIFYPLGLLFWFIRPEKAYGYTMFLHMVLAGYFMYLLSRSFRLTRAGSFVAAAVFTCNGFVMAILYMGHMCPVQSYIWLPLILYCLKRGISTERPYWWAGAAGLFWGIQILAGAPQDAFYTFLASMLFLVCHMTSDFKAEGYGAKLVTRGSILLLVGAGVAAIQLLPAFELIGESVRAELNSFQMVTDASFPPEGIVTTLMPGFFGSYVQGDMWISNVPWSMPQQNLYVGILPLFLLIFIAYREADHRRMLVFAGSLALIALVLSLGRHTPIYKLAYLLPGFDRFRAPSKIIVLWGFAMGLLAGRGMDDLARHRRTMPPWPIGLSLLVALSAVVLDVALHLDRSLALRFFSPFVLDAAIPEKMAEASAVMVSEFHRFTIFSLLIVVSLFCWIRGALKSKAAIVVLCALLLVDLVYVNGGKVRHDDNIYRTLHDMKRDLDQTIGQDKSVYRVGSFDAGLGANVEMYLGYQTVAGFTALFPHRYYEFINTFFDGSLPRGWQYFFYGRRLHGKLMDLLNVKYEIFYQGKEYRHRATSLPRAFVVWEHDIVAGEKVLDHMVSADFDPAKTVILEEAPSGFSSGQDGPRSSRVVITAYGPDQIAISADTSSSGYLVLSEIFYPGWKAFVDDRPEQILRGDYLLRVVPLPPGKHVVRLVYDPLSIKVGIGLSIMTIFGLVLATVYSWGRRKRRGLRSKV